MSERGKRSTQSERLFNFLSLLKAARRLLCLFFFFRIRLLALSARPTCSAHLVGGTRQATSQLELQMRPTQGDSFAHSYSFSTHTDAAAAAGLAQ